MTRVRPARASARPAAAVIDRSLQSRRRFGPVWRKTFQILQTDGQNGADLQFAPEGEEDITINCCVGGEAVDFSVGAACNCGLLSHFIFRGISFDGGIRRKEAFALNGVVKYLQALSFRGTRIGCWWLCPTLFLCCRCRSKAKCRLLSLLLFITHLLQVFKCSLSLSTP